MLVMIDAWRAGLLARHHWLPNLVAGVIVGIVALPLAMAFAIASGAKPEQGIYTAIVAGLLVSLCGGSRFQIAGPTGAFIVILSGITARYGVDGLQLATLMAGVILVFMGLARLGGVIKFIPAPVIVGFTAGIGVIIWIGQWPAFLGIPAPAGTHFHEKVLHLIPLLSQLHGVTTALAILGLALVILAPRLPGLSRVPGPLVAMVVVTALHATFHFEGVATIGSAFGGIPRGLPTFALPEFHLARMLELLGPAFTIAMLGAIESLLSAVVADGMTGTRHQSNQELIGQGVANIAAPLLGGFAATGAIARTATSIRNGATGPLAGVVHAITLVLIVLFLAPLASHIPLAVLASILFVVAWNMSEAHHFMHILRRAPRADVLILLITFFLTVFADLVLAVNVGVILATLHFLRRMASSVEVQRLTDKQLQPELTAQGLSALPQDVVVYAIEGPFFFGAVENFERALAQTHTDPHTLIIRLHRVPFMDMTGIEALADVIRKLQKRAVVVKLCEANPQVEKKLRKAGIIALLGDEHYSGVFTFR